MDFFFNPKGIAVIGATTNPHKGGNSILKNIVTGFKGGIYPVNPRYNEIEGLTCYDSVLNVPDPVDLAIVFHIFIRGAGVIPEISPLISMAREHEKPLFVWLLGKREEAFEFQKSTQDQGVPVYRELQRAVECMAAFFK